MTKVGTGESGEKKAYTAGVEAARSALISGGMTSCDLILLFATVGYDQQELLRGVRSVTGHSALAGCTGEGVITQTGPAGGMAYKLTGPERGEERVGVMAFSSDVIRFRTAAAGDLRRDSRAVGNLIGEQIRAANDGEPLLLLAFPDGYSVNATGFFNGLETALGEPIPCAGGMSGHNQPQGSTTYQYFNDRVLRDSVVCVLISGRSDLNLGVSHGCLPVGMDKTITKSHDNIIERIDDKSAWDFFRQYLEDGDKDLTPETATFISLGQKLPDDLATEYDRYIIRAPYRKNEDGSMVFGTEMPAGARVRVMRRDEEKISQGSAALARRMMRERGERKPLAVLQFDCAARGRMFFGDRLKEKEVDVAQDVFGKDVPWLGVFCFGELAPIRGKNHYHNQTVVYCALYE